MRWIIALICSYNLFAGSFDSVAPSSPEEIASLNADLLVGGFISAASGQPVITEEDLHIKAAQDLVFRRSYLSPQIFGRYDDKDGKDQLALAKALLQLDSKGWVILPHLIAGYNLNSPYFQVRDPQGASLAFEIHDGQAFFRTSGYGCSNLTGENPTAEADIRNIEFLINGTDATVIWPNGVQRVYEFRGFGYWRLKYELLPNGKAVRYFYNQQELARISTTDVSGKYVYASIDRVGKFHYRSTDGREIQLITQDREIKGKDRKKEGIERISYGYQVFTAAKNPAYSHAMDYNERSLLTFYDAKKYPIHCTYWQDKESLCRIQKLITPSGSTSFAYNPPIAGQKGGVTTVTHANGSQTIYRFNMQFLLSAIENWLDGKLYNQKIFSYDHKQHIAKIETKDGKGNLLLSKIYQCDAKGNPTLEKWESDSGVFTIERVFSKNRIIKDVQSDGLGHEYTYAGDTRLLTSKTTFLNGKQVRKTQYTYDEAYNLVKEEEVNKTITTYLLYQEGPHLHRQEWKIEKDWEDNLIHKTYFTYDRFGNLVKEMHYGSDGIFAYETTRIYDDRGNLIKETNPLGQTASYDYDSRGRCIQEIPFSQNIEIQRTFDEKGRLTTLQEGDHKTHFAYNASDELIQKTDYLGLETYYQYHPVHRKPIRIEEEPTILEMIYDDFGREISRKDAYGATTLTQPNGYGDPLTITYPDGGQKFFQYAPNRTLLSAIDPDGLKTSYIYDPLKRVTSKTVGTRSTHYLYDAYHLLEEKDPAGISTCYRYNLTGKKIEETRENRTLRFSYDPLGFLSKEEKGSRWRSYENDVLGRMLTKSIDGKLNTSYTYDPAGNVASIAKQHKTYFNYDPYNRLIEKIKADGSKTLISYKEEKKHLIKTTTDPKGSEHIEVYNPHGLLLKKEVPGSAIETYSYDQALRLASHDHLNFSYTPEGFLSSITETNQRTTSWIYTPGGKIQTKINPDGTQIQYEYTPDGDLARKGSREFQYDVLGRLIQGSGFTREYDVFGNVIQEEFDTGLTVKTSYDDFDRVETRILPDQSRIHYAYEGPFLTKIARIGSDDEIRYSHTYNQFDADGQVLSEKGIFTTVYRYNKKGERIFQTSLYFTENLAYDPSGNLIQKGTDVYTYDAADQVISSGQMTFGYDQHCNRTLQNDNLFKIDELNQLVGFSYDKNGNLLQSDFSFDEFGQLTRANGETISYDGLGRRLQKGSTSYLYFGNEEVAAFENGQMKELKISGISHPIALEIENQPYFPVVDVQGTIRKLIDPRTSNIYQKNTSDLFGVGLNPKIPYAYQGKRYDEETGLIYFGKRYYIPSLGRWLTPDPAGAIDHSNLYQYVLNNPYRFQDPNGETIGGYLLGLGEIALGGAIVLGGFSLQLATWGGFTFGVGLTTTTGAALMGHGLHLAMHEAQTISFTSTSTRPSTSSGAGSGYIPSHICGEDQLMIDRFSMERLIKEGRANNTDIYVPDRPLPRDPRTKEPAPEANAPHTELGTRDGEYGKYPQAREFDGKGNPIRDIDFTDHGRPQIHPNPHQHQWKPNPTGGTPERSREAQPLPEY